MKRVSFNENWLFSVNGVTAAVTLPHDAMLSAPRRADSPSGSGGAYFVGERYTYEKRFTLPPCESASLLFEGIFPTGEIFLDGEKAAFSHYGYGDSFVDISRLADGKEHTVRVVADNTALPNARWYSGAGLYRPVWLFTGSEAHILPEGIRVNTVSHSPAVIHIETAHTGGEVRIEILDGDRVVAHAEGDDIDISVPGAKLWSAERPYLYTCRAYCGEDETEVKFGIRTVQATAEGLLINGEPIKLRGGCIHHDNGVIGARTFDHSERRKVKRLKEFGFNAIRSAHNPICRGLLRACDEEGMYIMDEAWDMWYEHKQTYDYASRFELGWERDLESMVAKDYNHPSVVLYSIGNEVTEPYEDRGVELAKRLVKKLHDLDSTRPVTAGINPTLIMMRKIGIAATAPANDAEPEKPVSSEDFNKQVSEQGRRLMMSSGREDVDKLCSPVLDALDIAGYNYATPCYEIDAVRHPGRMIVGTETFPHDLPINWALVEKLPYVFGDFMWTAWDYLGEVGIGAWSYHADGKGFTKHYPWLLADTGAFDILGDDNAEAGLAAAVWGARENPYIAVRPVNQEPENLYKAMWRGSNAIPSWAWRGCEGRSAEVEVYSNAAEIELFLNGKSLGKNPVNSEFRAEFSVSYAPGELKAVAYNAEGKSCGESSLSSAEGELSLRIKTENEAIIGRPVYIDIDVTGENGVIERNADRKIAVTLEGAELLGFGSANPRTEESFITGEYTTYYGRSLLVVRPTEKEVKITASAPGIGAREYKFSVK